MISKTFLSVAALCLFTGCDAYWSQPQPNTYAAKASNPNPADGAKGVSPDTELTWSGHENAVTYDVYFGTESQPPFVRKQTETTFDPGPLDWDQTYYWKIDTVRGAQGDIWKFMTFWYGDPNAEEMDVRLNNRNTQKIHALLQKRFRKNGFDEQIASLTARVEEKGLKRKLS